MPKRIINRTVAIVIIIIAVFIFLIISPMSYNKEIIAFTAPVVDTIDGFQNLIFNVGDAVKSVWTKYFYMIRLYEQNDFLRTKLAETTMQLARARNELASLDRLKNLLEFRDEAHRRLITGVIIGTDPTNWFQAVVIDKGKRDGVEVGMGVISVEGAVGKVIKVSDHFSRVLIVTDRNTIIPAIISRSRAQGLIEGRENGRLRLKYLPVQADVKKGDKVVTSGLIGDFPKEIPVGEVTRVARTGKNMFLDIEVKPSVNFYKLEEVFVVIPDSEMKKELEEVQGSTALAP